MARKRTDQELRDENGRLHEVVAGVDWKARADAAEARWKEAEEIASQNRALKGRLDVAEARVAELEKSAKDDEESYAKHIEDFRIDTYSFMMKQMREIVGNLDGDEVIDGKTYSVRKGLLPYFDSIKHRIAALTAERDALSRQLAEARKRPEMCSRCNALGLSTVTTSTASPPASPSHEPAKCPTCGSDCKGKNRDDCHTDCRVRDCTDPWHDEKPRAPKTIDETFAFRCLVCPSAFKTLESLEWHVRDRHPRERPAKRIKDFEKPSEPCASCGGSGEKKGNMEPWHIDCPACHGTGRKEAK